MTNVELVRAALEKVGGKSNVLTATNCMTRLRVRVKMTPRSMTRA